MRDGFRASMGWLHTWAGILASGLLFAIFWMGTLSVFDKEIDQWMIPETRLVAPTEDVSYDALLPIILTRTGGETNYVNFSRPSARTPVVKSFYYDPATEQYERIVLDPASGNVIDSTDSLAGTGFIFPFHFRLHASWNRIGDWIVGFAGMSMLVLLVSGIFIHRKIIQEFFVFRPTKKPRRSILDLHNMTSLAALPFHFLIVLTGLMIFSSLYLGPGLMKAADGEIASLFEEVYGGKRLPPAGEPGELASLDAMVSEASRIWSERSGKEMTPDTVRIFNVGDKNATVYVRNTFPSGRVAMSLDVTTFNGSTGEVYHDHAPTPVVRAFQWLEGFHFVQFGHWPLRWLYFLAGLAGCAMIATGLLFWIQSRIRRGVVDPLKVRSIRALTVGSTTGIMLATAGFLLANRLLPKEAAALSFDRSDLEVVAFFVIWIGAFVHAALRGANSWSDQPLAISAVAFGAVVLNWVTTGHHLVASATAGLWSVFGMDLVLVAGGLAALVSGLKLRTNATGAIDPKGGTALRTSAPPAAAE
ncbi:MAG: PepSY-associated TM helix domain-containing protein [Pseudomonadota bacterium]